MKGVRELYNILSSSIWLTFITLRGSMTDDDSVNVWNIAKLLSLDKLNPIRFRTFNCYDVFLHSVWTWNSKLELKPILIPKPLTTPSVEMIPIWEWKVGFK